MTSKTLKPGLNFSDYLETLRRENDLFEVKTIVDPHLEVGAILRRVCEEKFPAPLFTNVKQCENSLDSDNLFNIFGAAVGLRQGINPEAMLAIQLGLDSSTPIADIMDFLIEAKKRDNFTYFD